MGFEGNPLPRALSSCPIPIQPNQSCEAEVTVGDQPKPLLVRKSPELVRRSLGLVPCLALLPLWAQGQHKADFLVWSLGNEPRAASLHSPSWQDPRPATPCQEPRWPVSPRRHSWGHGAAGSSAQAPMSTTLALVRCWYNFFPDQQI